jgi:hypothetical protein
LETEGTLNWLESQRRSGSKCIYGSTPLPWAAVEWHEAVVKLLAKPDDVEANSKENGFGSTTVPYAIRNGGQGTT